MEEIVSPQDPSLLLHLVFRKNDFSDAPSRVDLTHAREALQGSALSLPAGKIIAPHKHLPSEKQTVGTQETLIVIKGSVKSKYYDLKNNKIYETVLMPGDCSLTLRGAHSFEVLEEGTLAYEFKNGPYLGKEHDSESI